MKFTLARDRVIVTPHGHSIEFKKGVPTYVPPVCYEDVQAAGAVPEEELPEPEVKVGAEPQDPAERKLMLQAALEQVVKGNIREQFTAGGAPHTKALSNILGWTVSNRERDLAWADLRRGGD